MKKKHLWYGFLGLAVLGLVSGQYSEYKDRVHAENLGFENVTQMQNAQRDGFKTGEEYAQYLNAMKAAKEAEAERLRLEEQAKLELLKREEEERRAEDMAREEEEAKKSVEYLFNVPRIGSTFQQQGSPCQNGLAPQRSRLASNFWCSQTRHSGGYSSDATFQFSESGELLTAAVGAIDIFPNSEVAEAKINELFGNLGVKSRLVTNGGGYFGDIRTISRKFLISPSYERVQISYGCNVDFSSPRSRIPPNDPEYNNWLEVGDALFGAPYPWVSSTNHFSVFGGQVHIDEKDETGEKRCVMASILTATEPAQTLGGASNTQVEVVVYEINSNFIQKMYRK